MTGNDRSVGRQLETLWREGAPAALTDGELLARFTRRRDDGAERAFATLVERHGPMVLRVARGILNDPDAAEDAFQATFLVLVAKAGGLRTRETLGPWLYQVAHRTASCLRATNARRRRLDRRVATDVRLVSPEDADGSACVLHEEIRRLPDRLRVPVVLCDLQGQTHEQAALTLGWPVGTVKSRQARARDRLRDRLTRRGLAPGLGWLTLSTTPAAPLALTLVSRTTAVAIRLTLSRAIAPGPAAALARKVVLDMTLLRWWQAGSILLSLGAASGVGLIAQDRGDQTGQQAPAVARPSPRPDDAPAVVAVQPGKLDFTLIERGVVEPARSQFVTNDVEGTTTIINLLPDGSRVRRGDVVVELDSSTLRDQLTNQRVAAERAEMSFQQARTRREVAQIAVREYTEGIAPAEQARLQGRITQAEEGINRGRARLDRLKQGRSRFEAAANRRAGPETPADIAADLALADRLDAAELDLQARTIDLDAARGEARILETYTRDKTTRRLQAEAEVARLDEQAQESLSALAKTRIARLGRQIAACRILAPGDGLLDHAKVPGQVGGPGSIDVGETVRERQLLFRVIDAADPMRINAQVHESLVEQVKRGQTVRIKVEALPDLDLTGVVRSVATQADPALFQATGKKTYPTFIELDRAVPGLRPGMSARVEIAVFVLADVLAVPTGAVVRIDAQDWVTVRNLAGAIEWRAVTLGKANRDAVEVKQGLQPGDRVLIDPRPTVGPPAPSAGSRP